ncbi:MAG TPA: adenylate/guanylate cyclase domain-containing protein [Rhizomicrobium sp.]|nr:adenylate/guanylate cyclase domain-containing protein [Rhizomicrobium sp.]
MRAGPNAIGIWALPLAILVLAAAAFAFDLGGAATRLSGLEYDSYQHFKPRIYESPLARSGYDVRVLDIDAAAIAKYGNWPWPSDTLKRVTDVLKSAGAPIVVYAFALDANDPSSPQRFAAQLPPGPQNDAVRNALNNMVSADENLAASFQGIKAVTGFVLNNETGDDEAPSKAKIAFDGVKNPVSFVPRFAYATRSLPLFEAASAGTGALNLGPDAGGVLRNIAMVSRIGDAIVPSLDSEVMRLASGKAALVLHGAAGNMAVLDAAPRLAGISAGGFDVKTRRDGAMSIYFSRDTDQRHLLLSQIKGAQSLKDTIVYIAPPGEDMLTPGGYRSVGDIHAEALENMLLGESLKESGGYLPQLVFLLVAGAALLVLLIRAGLVWAGIFILAMLAAAQGFAWYLFSSAHLLIDAATPSAALALAYVGGAAARAVAIANARASLRRSFADMLPTAVIEKIARDPSALKLDGETRVVTCLSCGLRRYSELAQAFRDDPTDFTRMITTAMAPLIDAALDHGGTIGHLDGDSFMAYWNAPLDDSEHAIHACDAAQYMTLALATVNEQLSHERRFDGTAFAPMEIGIGISTGSAIAGGFTARGHTTYSVTGDCTILAAAIRELSEDYGPAIVVADDTRKAAERAYAFLEVDYIAAGVRDEAVKLFAILGNPLVRASPKFRALATFHEHIFQSVRSQQWEKARGLIEQSRNLSGASQKLYDLHAARIDWYEKNPPGADWDGAFRPILK